MLENTTQTVFAVARGEEIVSDGYTNPDTAAQQLQWMADTMEAVGLTPDVHLIEATVKTTVSKVKRYTPPAPQPDFEFEQPDVAVNEGHLSATGKGATLAEAADKAVEQATTAPQGDKNTLDSQ